MMIIPPVSSATAIGGIAPAPSLPSIGSKESGSFKAVFQEAIDQVGRYQQNAQQATDRFLSGEDEELHHVAIAGQQADLSFQLFMEVRNKVVSAYQEVMRMQI